MLAAIKTGLTEVITMVGSVIDGVVGAEGALSELLPLVGIGIAVSVLMLGFRAIRSWTWGA